MKKFIIGLLAFSPVSVFAGEVCEIGTVPVKYVVGNYYEVNCTSKVLVIGNISYSSIKMLEGERINIKKELFDLGYRPASQCSSYETYIKP